MDGRTVRLPIDQTIPKRDSETRPRNATPGGGRRVGRTLGWVLSDRVWIHGTELEGAFGESATHACAHPVRIDLAQGPAAPHPERLMRPSCGNACPP